MYFLKNNKIIYVLTLLLTGCKFFPMLDGVIYEPVNIRSVYYDSKAISIVVYESYGEKTGLLNEYIDNISSSFLSEANRLELSENGRWAATLQKLEVKGKNNCIIYSYSREDLIKLKTDAGFNLKSDDAIFLIERDGLRVVSRSEYERLKPTFKPHPFDASLCKAHPN